MMQADSPHVLIGYVFRDDRSATISPIVESKAAHIMPDLRPDETLRLPFSKVRACSGSDLSTPLSAIEHSCAQDRRRQLTFTRN
jgi:hypothetical protein